MTTSLGQTSVFFSSASDLPRLPHCASSSQTLSLMLWKTNTTQDQRTRQTWGETLAKDCGSMCQMRQNGCVAPMARSPLWALKKVRNAIDALLSWLFTQYRGHQKQWALRLFTCFTIVMIRRGHSPPPPRFFSLLHFPFIWWLRVCAYINFVVLACSPR